MAGDLRPDAIEIVASEPVNLTVTNEGRVFHDLTVHELNLQIDVQPGTTSTARPGRRLAPRTSPPLGCGVLSSLPMGS